MANSIKESLIDGASFFFVNRILRGAVGHCKESKSLWRVSGTRVSHLPLDDERVALPAKVVKAFAFNAIGLSRFGANTTTV